MYYNKKIFFFSWIWPVQYLTLLLMKYTFPLQSTNFTSYSSQKFEYPLYCHMLTYNYWITAYHIFILLYICDEIHLIQPIFLLDNTKSCIGLLTWYFSISPYSIFYPSHHIKPSTWQRTRNRNHHLSDNNINSKNDLHWVFFLYKKRN